MVALPSGKWKMYGSSLECRIAEAAVVGRPDDMTGEAICAFVVLKQARPSGDEAARIAKERAQLEGMNVLALGGLFLSAEVQQAWNGGDPKALEFL